MYRLQVHDEMLNRRTENREQKLLKDLIPGEPMKACLLLLIMLAAPESILFTEELQITDVLEYTVLVEELPNDLSAYQVIVISTPSKTYEAQKISALKAFVESGGGLMLLAEENNQNGTTLVLNQISQEFGITFNSDRIYDDSSYVEDTSWVNLITFSPHPVFQGVTSIVYTSGCSIEGEGMQVQASENAYSEKYDGLVICEKGDFPVCMVFSEVGKGKVFACGDEGIFEFLHLGDNTWFALNVFDWLTGNQDRIQERLTKKGEAIQVLAEAESALQSAREKGLQEVFPKSLESGETLISEAQTLYESYRYASAIQKALLAKKSLGEEEDRAQKMVDSTVKAASECLSSVEKGAQKYLPSQLEAAQYLVQQVEQEKTYPQKIEKAEEALNLCEEIRTGLEGSAGKEINLATEKLNSYKGLFGRKSHHSARIYLEYAEESYEKGNFGEAIEYAQQSQDYSEKAAQEQKKDYILVAGLVVLVVVLGYIYVRKR